MSMAAGQNADDSDHSSLDDDDDIDSDDERFRTDNPDEVSGEYVVFRCEYDLFFILQVRESPQLGGQTWAYTCSHEHTHIQA